MSILQFLGIGLALFLASTTNAHRLYNHAARDEVVQLLERSQHLWIQEEQAKQEKHIHGVRHVEHEDEEEDNNAMGQETVLAYCERQVLAAGSSRMNCSCNLFDDGVVELNCLLEKCLYCGDTESSSCGQDSVAVNLTTDGMAFTTMSYATKFQYNGTSGRNELVSFEEIDCTDSGPSCSSCRVLVNGTICNSCTLCSDGAIVNCENVIEGSSFNTCTSLSSSWLFEGLGYDVAECLEQLPSPSNDNCTSAIPILPGDVVSGTLTGALKNSVPSCQYVAGSHGVWYSFEGTGTPQLVSTCSESNPDRSVGLIALYQGSGCDLLDCLHGTSQESHCSLNSRGSSVLLTTEAGTTYYVYVSGWFEPSFGPFELSLTTLEAQSNGQCSAASEISVDGSAVVGIIEFSLTHAHSQGGRLGLCKEDAVDNYGVAWYQFVAAQDGTLRASTCAPWNIGWESSIAVGSGDCNALSCVEQSEPDAYYQTCSNGGTFVDFQVVAGTTYHVALWGSGFGDFGLSEFDIRSLNPPANDNCENAQSLEVESLTANFTATFSDVSLSSDESNEVCLGQIDSSNSGGIWYSFVGTGDIVIATACSNDFSPYLTIYTGSCGDLQCASPANWNIASRCSSYPYGRQSSPIASEEGELYYVLVSGSGPIAGSFDFSLRTGPPVENDSCVAAIQIEADGKVIIGSTEGAKNEGFNDSCYSSQAPGVWFSVLGRGGMLKADTRSQVTNFDTVISVYRGSCGDLQCVRANDDGCQPQSSSITWDTEENETYYIRVSSLSGEQGDYGLKVAPFVPAVNKACNGAINLPIGGTLSGTMEGPTGNTGVYSCYSAYPLPTLWYYIDGKGSFLKVSTCSPNITFYGGIHAFEGTSCPDLQCVRLTYLLDGQVPDSDCPYHSPATRFFAEAGQRYYIALIDNILRMDNACDGANSIFTLNVSEFDCEIAANDVCETALPIAVNGNEAVEGSTTNALPDNVTCDYYSSNAPGVWYSANGTGNVLIVSECALSLNFDPNIFVFFGGCGALECIAVGFSSHGCGESAHGGGGASFRTQVGVQYYILVTGVFSSAVGDFSLTLVDSVPPPNDLCSEAIQIAPNGGVIVGSVSNATSFLGSNYTCAYDSSSLSVWYSVIGTGEVLAISTCSSQLNFDSAISVSTGSCDDHVCVISNANITGATCRETSYSAARVTLRTEVGVEYYIAVEGLNSPSKGDFGLTVTTLQVPANDECPGAIAIQADSGTVSGSITNATSSSNPNATICGNYDVPDVWYSMVGTGEVYAVSTCSSVLNFDTSISISKGSCDHQECVLNGTYGYSDYTESSHSASRAVFRSEVGVEYFIVVKGVNYAFEGEFTLEVSKVETPTNDECSGAFVIHPGNTAITGSLANATGTVGLNSTCEFSPGAPGVWYSMVGTGDVYSISTCSNELMFDTALSVSTGSCDNQTCITTGAYNDNDCSDASFSAAKVVFRTEVGVEYYIHVQSLSSSSEGAFVLHLSTVVVPANDVCSGAISIPVGTGTVSGSITNATGTIDSGSSCSYSYNSPDVWYAIVGTGDVFAVSTCSSVLNFDSELSVSKGSCNNQECILTGSSNDENCINGFYSAARVVFRTDVGVQYFISVQGVNYPSAGDFELQISKVDIPANVEPLARSSE